MDNDPLDRALDELLAGRPARPAPPHFTRAVMRRVARPAASPVDALMARHGLRVAATLVAVGIGLMLGAGDLAAELNRGIGSPGGILTVATIVSSLTWVLTKKEPGAEPD